LDRLREMFNRAEIEVVGFDGRTSVSKRKEAIDEFQQGSARVFLAQQSAAGVAINLSAANEVVLVEPSFSPEDNRQPIHRILNIGKSTPCRARYFAVQGTLDNAVLNINAQKMRMMTVLP
jgi:SNF2 family DNA or RNA helicase